MNNNDIKFTYSTTEVKTYEDGFADGYSRAWVECWEHMRQIAAEASEPESDASKTNNIQD